MPHSTVFDQAFVLSEDGQPTCIRYDAVRTFHMDGNFAMLAIAFLGLQGALRHLAAAHHGQVSRHAVQVITGHPGTGVRDAFEYITRAVTRSAYVLDNAQPYARLNPHADFSYSWIVTEGPHRVLCKVREGVLPERFYALFGLARRGELDDSTRQEFDALKCDIEARVLALAPEQVLDFMEYPAPCVTAG